MAAKEESADEASRLQAQQVIDRLGTDEQIAAELEDAAWEFNHPHVSSLKYSVMHAAAYLTYLVATRY